MTGKSAMTAAEPYFKDPREVADRLGLACVLPEPNELFIDLDDEGDRTHLDAMLALLASLGIYVERVKETVSKSGRAHVYLRSLSYDLDPLLRIALQACLGSDRKHELLSLVRVLTNQLPATVFFEKPSGVIAPTNEHPEAK